MSIKIVLTGGGSAGHVTPNLALIEALLEQDWEIDYLGSAEGVEKKMITAVNIPFHNILTGKLRRYFSWQNFFDPCKILVGIVQAFFLLRRLKTEVVFSKGGFVAFPVVFAAWLNRIPVIAHESDLTPGLANRLCFPFVNKLCVTFAGAKKHFKNTEKVIITGTPIRQQLFKGDSQQGLALCGFQMNKPCLMVMGGGQGSQVINQVIRDALPELTKQYQIIHLCGQGKRDHSHKEPNYFQLEYADQELPHLYAACDLIISRAGANSLYEILALKKPHLLIPLSGKVSRGDQIENAAYFAQQKISLVIQEENLTVASLMVAVKELTSRREEICQKIEALDITSATSKIIALLKEQLD